MLIDKAPNNLHIDKDPNSIEMAMQFLHAQHDNDNKSYTNKHLLSMDLLDLQPLHSQGCLHIDQDTIHAHFRAYHTIPKHLEGTDLPQYDIYMYIRLLQFRNLIHILLFYEYQHNPHLYRH